MRAYRTTTPQPGRSNARRGGEVASQPGTATPAALQALQRSAGNRAVSRVLQRQDDEAAGGQVRSLLRAGGRPIEKVLQPARSVSARPAGAGMTPCASAMLHSQRAMGNRAVSQLMASGVVQTKLRVGPAGDRYEQEADRVADAVMRAKATSGPVVGLGDDQRVEDDCPGGVRRRACSGPPLGLDGGLVEPDAERQITRARGRGQPLPETVRTSMEATLGADLGAVRLHAGPESDALNRSMQSHAFTVGKDIFFARSQYRPATSSGQRLLAHELTHVLQQGATVHRHPAEAVIRRYTVTKPDSDKRKESRLSNSKKVRKVEAHKLFADSGLVDSANAKLSKAGGGKGAAAGSFLKLVTTTESDESRVRVVPVVVKRTTGLSTAQSPRRKFLEQGGGSPKSGEEPSYISPADCHVAAQTVMGSDETPIGAYDTEKPMMGGKGKVLGHFEPAVEGGAHLANRAKHAFFASAMPKFADLLEGDPLWKHSFVEVISAIRAINPAATEFGKNNPYAAVYRDKILPVTVLVRMFSATFKINEWAEAEVGRAFSNVNDETQKLAGESAGKDVWNFHWAGVVLVDGPDYVTLENLSTENINELNDKWYFEMYGKAQQSFHAEALKDPHATPAAISMGFEAVSQPAHPKVTFTPTKNQQVVLGWMVNPANDQAVRAALSKLTLYWGADPFDTLKSICSRLFSLNDSDVANADNFSKIHNMIRQAIAERKLPTLSPAKTPSPGHAPPPPPPKARA